MDKLQFFTILYFLFEHFTVLKQILTLSTLRVLEHINSCSNPQFRFPPQTAIRAVFTLLLVVVLLFVVLKFKAQLGLPFVGRNRICGFEQLFLFTCNLRI